MSVYIWSFALSALAVDHFSALLRKSQVMAQFIVQVYTLLSWCVAFLASMPFGINSNLYKHASFPECQLFCVNLWPVHSYTLPYDVASRLLQFALPSAAMIVLYVVKFRKAKSTAELGEEERRKILVLFAISLLFIAKWSLFLIVNRFRTVIAAFFVSVVQLLPIVGAVVNPFLFAQYNVILRTALPRVFHCTDNVAKKRHDSVVTVA